MFTGIIQKITKIHNARMFGEVLVVDFVLPKGFKTKLGSSISINGVCSTVTKISKTTFSVGYMKETLDKTTVRSWGKNKLVNLEPSLRLGDGLDGHFVYGHIDTVGAVKNIIKKGDSRVIEIATPKEFLKFVVYKGSIAVDGVSLTVSARNSRSFEISLIPYTLEHTNLSELKIGDSVNVEVDVLGKYILNQNPKHEARNSK